MKIFIYILMLLSLGLVVYNATMLDFNHLLEGESSIAAISVLAGLCSLLLLTILLVSKKIASKTKG